MPHSRGQGISGFSWEDKNFLKKAIDNCAAGCYNVKAIGQDRSYAAVLE